MMRAKLVVFPIRGRNWCFSRSIAEIESASASLAPSTIKELWITISSSNSSSAANAELLTDFVSNKMNKAWVGLEKAPEGSFKKKLHGLNARLVRRRLRHVAMRGTVIHKKYFYGSVSLLPLTAAFSVLPLPNVPFFWILFRSYSHWRALKGSEKLLQLVSDCSQGQNTSVPKMNGSYAKLDDSENISRSSVDSPWVLLPSKELEELTGHSREENEGDSEGLSKSVVCDICKAFDLNVNDVLKYRNSL